MCSSDLWGGRIAGRTAIDGRLALDLRARPPSGNPLATLPLSGRLRGHWIRGGVAVERLEGELGRSRLLADGRLTRQLSLRGGWWLEPSDLPQAQRLPAWLRDRPLQGRFSADGPLLAPRLAATTVRHHLPLIGSGSLALRWSHGLLELSELRSEHLLASATLPLRLVRGRGVVWGELHSRLQLRDYPLSRLNRWLGSHLHGSLDADGSLQGPLAGLLPDLRLRLQNPGAGPLRLQETWSGTLVGSAEGGRLRLVAHEPSPQGRFEEIGRAHV